MKNLIILGLLLTVKLANLQAQSTWSITPSDYQFNMTITADVLLDCAYSASTDDEIAAFVGTDLRGVINFGTSVNGKNLAYLVVYSNVSQGELLNFKIYDASTGIFTDLLNEITFEENETVGNGTVPYEFFNNNPPTDLSIANLAIFDIGASQDTIADFLVSDLDNDIYTFTLSNSGGNDNSNFQLIDNYLILVNDVNIVNQDTYVIEITAEANGVCNITRTFTLDVINTNDPPYDIQWLDDDNRINEKEALASVVGELLVLDSTITDSHVFTLDSPSTYFSISGNQVLSEFVFDYEVQDKYLLKVRVTDAAGNFYVETLTIDIIDVVELNDLKANNVITPNGDGFNDFFTIPNIELFSDFELIIYNENGNQVFRRTASAGYNNLWNGRTLEGYELPSGSYYYTLVNPSTDEKFIGVINLLRN